MSTYKHVVYAIAMLIGLLMTAADSSAGPVSVHTPVGGSVTIAVGYKDGSEVSQLSKDGSAIDEDKTEGVFKYTIKDEDTVTAALVRSDKKVKGFPQIGKLKLGSAGLQSFEPIDIFTFFSSDLSTILFSDIDVSAFTSAGISLSEDDVLTAVNGVVAGLDGVIFRDAASLFAGADFFSLSLSVNSPLLDNLPRYSGAVTVGSALQFRLPEPGTLSLVVVMLATLAGFSKWRNGVRRGAGPTGGSGQRQARYDDSVNAIGWGRRLNAGIAPRRSSSVCSLMAALVERNGAQSNKLKHRSMVLESSA